MEFMPNQEHFMKKLNWRHQRRTLYLDIASVELSFSVHLIHRMNFLYENKKSFAKLSCPIVACELGRFYKKEAVIELLLDRNQLTGRFSPEIHETCFHIRNMKDVTVSQWNAPKPFLLRNLSILCNFFTFFNRDIWFSFQWNLKIQELNLTLNPNCAKDAKPVVMLNGSAVESGTVDGSQFHCPITGLEMSGRYRFVFFLTCGCVVSGKVQG